LQYHHRNRRLLVGRNLGGKINETSFFCLMQNLQQTEEEEEEEEEVDEVEANSEFQK
jgi:hypothetical protein